MTEIEIRINIDVPERDEEKFQAIIEAVHEVIKQQYPEFKQTRMTSPIRVSIREVHEAEE